MKLAIQITGQDRDSNRSLATELSMSPYMKETIYKMRENAHDRKKRSFFILKTADRQSLSAKNFSARNLRVNSHTARKTNKKHPKGIFCLFLLRNDVRTCLVYSKKEANAFWKSIGFLSQRDKQRVVSVFYAVNNGQINRVLTPWDKPPLKPAISFWKASLEPSGSRTRNRTRSSW